MEVILNKLKIPISIIFIGALLFSFYETSQIEIVSDVTQYIIEQFTIPVLICSILTTMFFHYLEPKFRAVFNGDNSYWLSRLKLAGRILITFPGLILAYYIIIQSVISFVNRNIGEQIELVIDGNIVDTYQFTSKGKTHFHLEIEDQRYKGTKSVQVDSDTYYQSKIGDRYMLHVTVGSLGFMYKQK